MLLDVYLFVGIFGGWPVRIIIGSVNFIQVLLLLNQQQLGVMIRAVPKQDYQSQEVVFIRDAKDQLKPAKIVIKSSYGTYKVKIYGTRDEEYVSQYKIEPYSQKTALSVANSQGKNNKKMVKFLKTAEKDYRQFKQNVLPSIEPVRACKEEEEDVGEGANIDVSTGRKQFTSKHQAIMDIKIVELIQASRGSKEATFSYFFKGKEYTFRENSKQLLIKRLGWALDDVSLEIQNRNADKIIQQIMESDIIQPVQYVTTPVYRKLGEAIQTIKKTKQVKLKNYLLNKKALIISGIQNYMCNYSLFLRVKEDFKKFLAGPERNPEVECLGKRDNNKLNESFPELNMTKQLNGPI